jgi:hypothetical protein
MAQAVMLKSCIQKFFGQDINCSNNNVCSCTQYLQKYDGMVPKLCHEHIHRHHFLFFLYYETVIPRYIFLLSDSVIKIEIKLIGCQGGHKFSTNT